MTAKEIGDIKESLMQAALCLRHAPTEAERQKAILRCEKSIALLEKAESAANTNQSGKRGADSEKSREAARRNGAKGGRPPKQPNTAQES